MKAFAYQELKDLRIKAIDSKINVSKTKKSQLPQGDLWSSSTGRFMIFVKASERPKRRSQANVLLFYFHVDLNKLYFCVTTLTSDSEILNAAWERLSFSISKYNILKKNFWILSLLHSLLDPVSQLIFIFSWIRRLYLMESWRIVKGKQWQKKLKIRFFSSPNFFSMYFIFTAHDLK